MLQLDMNSLIITSVHVCVLSLSWQAQLLQMNTKIVDYLCFCGKNYFNFASPTLVLKTIKLIGLVMIKGTGCECV